MSLHQNKRLWQRHVLAENRRSIEGLLETLSMEPVYTVMATNSEHRGRAAVAAFYTGLFDIHARRHVRFGGRICGRERRGGGIR